MRHFLILFAALGGLLLGGCREAPVRTGDTGTETVRVEIRRSGKPFFSAVSSLELTPLETTDRYLLGSCVQLSLLQDGYLLADRKNFRIYRYSADGRFLNEIGRRGNGPGEYIGFRSVQADGSLVHVFDASGKEIVYGQDGDFLREKQVPVGFHVCRDETGILSYYGYSGQREYRLIHESEADGSEAGFLKLDARLLALDLENEIFSPAAGGGVCFIDSYSPTVYLYRDGQAVPYLSFDFGKYALPASFFKAQDAFAAAEELFSSDYAVIASYAEEGAYKLVHVLLKDDSQDRNWSEYGLYDGNGWRWFSLSDNTDEALPGPLRFFESGTLYGLFGVEELSRMSRSFAPAIADRIEESLSNCDQDAYVIAKIHI